MVPGLYRELFAAIAATAGSLTGLLFVALSVTSHAGRTADQAAIHQVRAAAALLSFTNAMVVSLFSLVPGTNPGYPAVALGIIGLLFTAAGVRSILSSRATRRQKTRQLGLIGLLLLIFGTELVCGLAMLVNPDLTGALQMIGYALITSVIVGVARAWELVGDRDTGIMASIAVLTGHTPSSNDPRD